MKIIVTFKMTLTPPEKSGMEEVDVYFMGTLSSPSVPRVDEEVLISVNDDQEPFHLEVRRVYYKPSGRKLRPCIECNFEGGGLVRSVEQMRNWPTDPMRLVLARQGFVEIVEKIGW